MNLQESRDRSQAPRSLVNEIDASVSLEDALRRGITDTHVVGIMIDPWGKNIGWVFNYSYPAGKYDGWGLPGGRRELLKDITIRDTGVRELREETGIEDFRDLGVVREGLVFNHHTQTTYYRVVFLCVPTTPGNPRTQAFSETKEPQTREFRWVPRGRTPKSETVVNGESIEERVYFTHAETLRDPEVQLMVARAVNYFERELAEIAESESWRRVAQQHLSPT